MEKEGFRNIFNSRDGKVNLFLLFFAVLIFIVMMASAEAITVNLFTPGNLTYNGTRNLNFTFNVTLKLNNEIAVNCTLYTNTTGTWQQVKSNDSENAGADDFVANQSVSYMNYTASGTTDGNFSWNVGCIAAGALTFATLNSTFFIDSLPPVLTLDTPNGGVLSDNTQFNISSYGTSTFYVNVSDNSTVGAFIILNSQPFVIGAQPVGGTNASNNTMTAGVVISAPDRRQFYFNVSGIFNFNNSFASPGPHSVQFCANDSLGRTTCTNRSDFIIKGMNVTQMENMFSTSLPQGSGGLAFGGLNITFGNGTEIPDSTFMNPLDGINYGGVTMRNFTFIFNFSSNFIVHIVGGRINEGQFGNASNSRLNSTPEPEVRRQLGTGYSSTMGWADIASFIPSEVSYKYGILQLGGVGYSKHMYCNGTSQASPNCHSVSQCNSTVFGIFNDSLAIPTNDACWLESGTINGQALSSGYTYIFVDHFSGGLGGSDFSQVNVTYKSPLFQTFNTSTALNTINFTLEDINSTGLNLTANNSINVTLYLGGSQVALFSFINSGTTNLSCTSSDTVSPQNTTSVTCNVTYAFSNGTYQINVTARDTSNNSNPVNISTGNITITVDQIPPVFDYVNFTGNASFNTSVGIGDGSVLQLNNSAGISRAQGDAVTGIIYAIANWTDNLTKPNIAQLQFYNKSVSAWQTLNFSSSISQVANNGTWTNFSFPIPKGHNNFEGKNVSFRIIANDSLGNIVGNSGNISGSASIKNFTISINDTTAPTIVVTVGNALNANLSNISTTTPTIVWNITENNFLRYVAVQIDGSTDSGCNMFVNYTSNANSKRNNTLTVLGTGGCAPLSNGTHWAYVTTLDDWNNNAVYNHTFTVQSGVVPGLALSNLSNGLTPINNSNVTSFTKINFSVYVQGTEVLQNISLISSCNSTVQVMSNNVSVTPFNASLCPDIQSTTSNQTVTVTTFDTAGNSNSTVFGFLVDNAGPTLTVNAPTDGLTSASNVSISLTAVDGSQKISFFGYYVDNTPFVGLNTSTVYDGAATTVNLVNATNFTAGTHNIKFTVNDTLGNVKNSSTITFTATGPVNFINVNSSISAYIQKNDSNITNINVRIKSGTGYVVVNSTNETSGALFQIEYELNGTVNVSLTDINGTAANWNKVNFTPYLNNSGVAVGIKNNWTNTPLVTVWFNNSVEEFVLSNDSYYGTVVLSYNLSGNTSLAQEFWWLPNENDLTTRTNISKCSSAFTATTTTPCWNYSSGGRTIIQVPHFSAVVAVNDTTAPTITINVPITILLGNQTVSSFAPNITVSTDAVSCVYQVNVSDATTSPVAMTKSGTTCMGQTTNFKSLNAVYNITFNATDAAGNVASVVFYLNVSDTTAPDNGIISTSASTTAATVTVTGANETVNVTVNYGTTNTSLTSSATNTAFAATESVSLSSLTASTTYYYNVTVCDFSGNCKTNSTVFSFATGAAAAAAAASSSSSGGGGSAATAGGTTTAGTAASASRQWDSLESGSSGTLTIHNADIGVTSVTVDVQNTVSNPSLTVGSYSSNPLSTEAAGKVYQYLEVSSTNIADSDISKATISFAVPKSWLTSNNVNEDDIVLYRYHDNAWSALSTAKTGEDSLYYMYQATTPGFSTYAIGNKEAAPPAAAPAPTAPSAPTEAPAAPTAPAAPAPAAAAAPSAGLSTTTIAWIVVAVIVVIAAIGYFMMQRKKE